MEIENEQFINISESTASNNDFESEKNIIKNDNSLNNFNLNLMLKDIFEKYPIGRVTESLTSSCLQQKNNNNPGNEIPELEAIITNLNQKGRVQNIIKATIDFPKNKNQIISIDENKTEIKRMSTPSTNEDEIYIDINSDRNNNKNEGKINDNNNIIIDIHNNYVDIEAKKNKNDNKKNCLKKETNQQSINIKIIPRNNETKKIISEKPKNEYNPKKISYHCSIINGIYYKYKYVSKIDKTTLFKYKCSNLNCPSWGIYDISDKTFMLQKKHWNGKNIFCCDKYMKDQDKKNYAYMKKNNIDEIQMYNDEK